MRIVAIADTHGDHDDLGVLPDGDVLVHAGDTGWDGDHAGLRCFADWFRSQPHTHKILVSGNHDRCFAYQPEEAIALLGPEVDYLQDSDVTIDGSCSGAAPGSLRTRACSCCHEALTWRRNGNGFQKRPMS